MVNINDVTQNICAIRSEDCFCADFKHNGSTDMNINGSVNSVEFHLSELDPDQDILLQSISFVLATDELIDLTKFGNVAQLANGIIFQAGNNSKTINDNAGVMLITSSQFVATAEIGIGNTSTVIVGRWDFTDTFGGNAPVLINVRNLKMIVQDNLSTIPLFRVSCHGIKIQGA
jgi:hypothetical protein